MDVPTTDRAVSASMRTVLDPGDAVDRERVLRRGRDLLRTLTRRVAMLEAEEGRAIRHLDEDRPGAYQHYVNVQAQLNLARGKASGAEQMLDCVEAGLGTLATEAVLASARGDSW